LLRPSSTHIGEGRSKPRPYKWQGVANASETQNLLSCGKEKTAHFPPSVA